WRCIQLLRHSIERRENSQAALVEHVFHAIAARAAFGIFRRTVLAGEKATRERKIADDPKLLALTELGQTIALRLLELRAIVEVVPGLQRLIARQAFRPAHLQRLA